MPCPVELVSGALEPRRLIAEPWTGTVACPVQWSPGYPPAPGPFFFGGAAHLHYFILLFQSEATIMGV